MPWRVRLNQFELRLRVKTVQFGTDLAPVALLASKVEARLWLVASPHDDIDVTTITFTSPASRAKSIGQSAGPVEKSENPESKEYCNDDPRAD